MHDPHALQHTGWSQMTPGGHVLVSDREIFRESALVSDQGIEG